MKTTAFTAHIKATGGDPKAAEKGLSAGEFTALVSVFDSIDSYGEIVVPGAFTDTLKAWAEAGDPIPVVWAHQWADPFAHIGHVVKAQETADGLLVTAQLDLADNPTAAQVHKLLKARRITQFSFAYDVLDGAPAERDGQDVYELRSLRLHEVGPCLIGVNQDTELVAAKALALAKSRRVLSQKNRDALAAAQEAIAAALAGEEPDERDEPTGESGEAQTPPVQGAQTPAAPAADDDQHESSQAATPASGQAPDGADPEPQTPRATRRALAVATITNL